MPFLEIDGVILHKVAYCDGVAARRQLMDFPEIAVQYKPWVGQEPHALPRGLEKRLAAMKAGHYIEWPSREQRKTRPIPESVIWIGPRGAIWLAAQRGIHIEEPKSFNEYQLRKLKRDFKKQGFRWMRQPRFNELSHDLLMTDLRLKLERDLVESTWIAETGELVQQFVITEQVLDGDFRSDPDETTYDLVDAKGKKLQKGGQQLVTKKLVIPDWYSLILDTWRQTKGDKRCRIRGLWELDNKTHTNRNFKLEKVVPGVAYIKSPAYKARFGYNNGVWFVVTSGGEERMQHLMMQAIEAIGNTNFFRFSTTELCFSRNMAFDPIWWRAHEQHSQPEALFTPKIEDGQ